MTLEEIENKVKDLERIFLSKPEHYFFTEKEIHSEFYSLFRNHKSNTSKHSLFHTEYPTPFKCSIKEYEFNIEESDSKYKRSHIDSVILNPNFINWIESKYNQVDLINGTAQNNLFENYFLRLIKAYEEFHKETKESILLYAFEFKYFRHSYTGIKQPIKDISQDLSKMKTLKLFGKKYLNNQNAFALKTECIVVLGGNIKKEVKNDLIKNFDKDVKFIMH